MEISKKDVNKHSRKIHVNRGRYSVCKKESCYFDCADLYIEMLILLNCEFIGKSRPCTNILRWIIEILYDKWDNIRFINFEKALEIATNILIPNSLILDYYQQQQQQQKNIKDICRKAKVADDEDVIMENKDFFVNGNNLYDQHRDFVFNIIRAGDDLYGLDEFKYDDLFDSFIIQQ